MFSIIIFISMLIAITLVVFGSEQTAILAKQRLHSVSRFNMRKREEYAKSELEMLMKQAGIPFSLYHYQVVRILAFALLFMIFGLRFLTNVSDSLTPLLIVVLFFLLTTPKETILNLKSPFTRLIHVTQANKRNRYNEELYLSISQLRNSFKVYGKKAPSAIEMFEEITKYTTVLKPIFQKLISFWMLDETEKAVEYFEKEIQTSEAKKLSQVFLKLDSLDPKEFDEQLLTFQQIYRGKRETERRKKDELNSYILFAAVLVTAMIILINFIIVGFLIDILNQTSTLF